MIIYNRKTRKRGLQGCIFMPRLLFLHKRLQDPYGAIIDSYVRILRHSGKNKNKLSIMGSHVLFI